MIINDTAVGTEFPSPHRTDLQENTRTVRLVSGDHMSIYIGIDAAKAASYNYVFAHGMLSMADPAKLVT